MAELNAANRTLFRGDNLPFLRGLNSASVDLIATDPPFNKNRDFHATPDSLSAGASFQDRWSWQDDVQLEWLNVLSVEAPEVYAVIDAAKAVWGDDMGAFLCWLGVRLLECHRILKPTGSLYLHIDHTAHAWVKCLLDAIFGRRNFRNEIAWCYRTGGASKRTFARKHDTLLFYSKSDNYKFNLPLDKSYLTGQMGHRVSDETFTDEWGVYQNILFSSTLIKLYKDERGYFTLTGCRDYWNIDAVGRTGKERTGYPTQKPLALYERIIQASSQPGDVVLDPFSGCATTPVAAERLGRQWIGIDIWEKAYDVVCDRLKQEGLALPDDAEPSQRNGQGLLTYGDIVNTEVAPTRTDGGGTAAPYLAMPQQGQPARRYPDPRTQHPTLLTDFGAFCQGCGRDYSFDTRALEVDHKWPRSAGGDDRYENLTLLCGPCNKVKKDKLTLEQLQEENRRTGQLLPANEVNLKAGQARHPGRRPRRSAINRPAATVKSGV